MIKNTTGVELQIGDIFFIGDKEFSYWYISEENRKKLLETFQRDILRCTPLNYSFKLAVKYLGSGVVEEMVTGEKILIQAPEVYFDKVPCTIPDAVGLTDAKSFEISSAKKMEDYASYANKILEFKKLVDNYPPNFRHRLFVIRINK